MRTLCLLAVLALPARAQVRVERLPALPEAAAGPAAAAPAFLAPPAASPLNGSLAAAEPPRAAPAAAASPAAEPAAAAEELDFVAGAPARLAAAADDLAGARGLKARDLSGGAFLALIDEARARADAEDAAPTPAAAAAARAVRAEVARVARALIPADRPLAESLARALAVWQVMGQELAEAAKARTLSAVARDAGLFASQVEESAVPAAAAPPAAAEAASAAPGGLRPSSHPEDPDGHAEMSQPGSVFGWKPAEESPGHGFAPLDALIRRALAERPTGARDAGFELPGAARREDARVFFYGERHTDGALIAANMRRLAADARPGRPALVLVEGYTGWPLRGFEALRYLAARGLHPEALSAKGVGPALVELRGWDTIDGYGASKRPLLQHHMDLLELNRLAHSDARGWRYYRDVARAAWTAWRSREELQRAAIVARNRDLDAAVARAVRDADAAGATVHVIAGADHLLENPRLSALTAGLVPPAFRASLRSALSGRPFWASKPAASGAEPAPRP
jgi:hypothetical protein